jgi:hypothetical protein
MRNRMFERMKVIRTRIESITLHQKRVSQIENECCTVRILPNAVSNGVALQTEDVYMRDASKPSGEACNADNTLKDASQIKWIHLPSQEAIQNDRKRGHCTDEESGSEDELPKPKRKVNAEIPLLIMLSLMVSPDFSQQTCQVTRTVLDSDKISDDADEREGDVEKRVNADMDDGSMESDDDEDDVPYTADEEAARDKFHLMLKESNIKQVCMFRIATQSPKQYVILPCQTATVTQKCVKTRDVRLCFREHVRIIDGKETMGYYCMLCLNGRPPSGDLGWQTGNVTVQ